MNQMFFIDSELKVPNACYICDMALPFIKIIELLFQATPLLSTASELVKKVRKETNTKIHEVESSLEYKVELLEKKLNEQVKMNNNLANHLEEASNALIKVRKSVLYVLILAGASVIISVSALLVVIIK